MRIANGNPMKALILLVTGILLAAFTASASPIAVNLPSGDLTDALDNFTEVSFNGFVRWESRSSSSQYKIRIADGTSGNPGIANGGGGITWETGGPQSFSFSFDGSTAIMTIVDGAQTYTVSADPANTAMNSLLIGVRSRANTTIEISNLKIDGVSLNIGSLSLGNTNDRSFLFVTNVFAPFTLTGLLQMTNRGGGSGSEIPALQIFAGMSPLADEGINAPEPATFLLVGGALLAAALVTRRRGIASAEKKS